MSKILSFIEHSTIKVAKVRDLEKKVISEKDREYLLKVEFQKKRVFKLKNGEFRTLSIVGSVALKDGLTIEILPKLLKDSLNDLNIVDYRKEFIKLLRISENRAIFGDSRNSRTLRGELPISSYIIELFSESLLKELQKGGYMDYYEVLEDSSTIRGRIDMNRTIQRHNFDRSKLVVSYRKRGANSKLMRIFKSLSELLLSDKDTPYRAKKSFAETVSILKDVSSCRLRIVDFKDISFNRLNSNFKTLFYQAEMIFGRYMPFSADINSSPFWSILFDMDTLFEDLTANLFRKSAIEIGEQESFQIYENIKIRPDITVYSDGVMRSVIDAKYKIFKNRPSREDMHQLITYISTLNLKNGYFIYPTFEDREVIVLEPKIGGGTIRIIFLNIGTGIDRLVKDFYFYLIGNEINIGFNSYEYKKELSLFELIEYGYINLAKSFIERSSREYLNLQNSKGETVLMLSLYYEQTEIVELLIKKGADIFIKDFQGDTAIIYAIGNNRQKETELLALETNYNSELLPKLLSSKLDLSKIEFSNCDPSFIGCEIEIEILKDEPNFKNIEDILKRGVELKEQLITIYNSYMEFEEDEDIDEKIWIQKNNKNVLELAELLLKYGAYPNEILFESAESGHYEIVELLLKYNANPFIGKYNLYKIAENKKTKEVLKKYDAHLNPSKKDDIGRIFLNAVYRGNHNIVNYLIDIYKIDLNTKNIFGETALDIAIERNHTEIVELLRKAMKKLTLKEIAVEILKEDTNSLLSATQIWEKGKHLYSGKGKTPERTIHSDLSRSIKNNENIFYREKISENYHYGLVSNR